MANPLYNQIVGGNRPPEQPAPNNAPQISMQDAMNQLRSNTAQMIKQAGYSVPDEIANNPQASVMHIVQTGQVRGPMLQRIQPMLNMLMGRR